MCCGLACPAAASVEREVRWVNFITQSRKDTKIRKLDNLLLCAFAALHNNFYTLERHTENVNHGTIGIPFE
jgi:hypothetical protein